MEDVYDLINKYAQIPDPHTNTGNKQKTDNKAPASNFKNQNAAATTLRAGNKKAVNAAGTLRANAQTNNATIRGGANNELSNSNNNNNSNAACPLVRFDVLCKVAYEIELRYIEDVGIFRIPGDSIQIDSLLATFDEPEKLSFKKYDGHTIAGALKLYLRKQPKPLISSDLVKPLPDDITVPQVLEKVIQHLTVENKCILRRLLMLLRAIDLKSNINKMNSKNLGMVFGPTIVQADSASTMIDGFQITGRAVVLCTFLIDHFPEIMEHLNDGQDKFRVFGAPPPLSQREIELLTTNAKVVQFSPQAEILADGQHNSLLHMIKSGEVAIMKKGKELRRMKEGEIFGEMSFLGSFNTSAQVVAMTTCYVSQIEPNFLNSLFSAVDKEKDLFFNFYWRMAEILAMRYASVSSMNVVPPLPQQEKITIEPEQEQTNNNINNINNNNNNNAPAPGAGGARNKRMAATFDQSFLDMPSNQQQAAVTKTQRRANRNCAIDASHPLNKKEQNNNGTLRVHSSGATPETNNNIYIKVMTTIDGSVYQTIPSSKQITVGSLLQQCLSRFSIIRADQAELYLLTPEEGTFKLMDRNKKILEIEGENPALDKSLPLPVLLTSTPPKIENFRKRQPNKKNSITASAIVIIKEYKNKCNGVSGVMYITQQYLTHFSRVFGMEKKNMVTFDEMVVLTHIDNTINVATVKRDYLLSFKRIEEADEAYRILRSLQQKLNKLVTSAELSDTVKLFVQAFKAKPPVPFSTHSEVIQNFLTSTEQNLNKNPLWSQSPSDLINLRESLERYLTSELYSILFTVNVEADKQINDRITHFHWVSYRHLDLPNFPPSLHFNSAIRCMRKIDEVKAPYDKLKQIVEASKFIYEIIGSREGADLFLPIFVITLIKSNPPNLQSNIEKYRGEDKLCSEGGYYLIMLESAILFLLKATEASFSNVTALDLASEPLDKNGEVHSVVIEEPIRSRSNSAIREERTLSMMEVRETILKQRNMKHFQTQLVNQRTSVRLSRNLTNMDDQAIYKKLDFMRARVVKEYVATSWAELTLRLDEIILIMSQQEDEDNNFARKGWLCGECAGCRGWFPIECVERLYEPTSNKQFCEAGYKTLSDFPTKEDWKLILLRCSNSVRYPPNKVVVMQGDYMQRVYQMVSGKGELTRKVGDQIENTKLLSDQTFGDISLLLGATSPQTLTTLTDAEVNIIEATELQSLFTEFPHLGGRFFKYLSSILERKLREEESRVFG